MPIGLNHNTEIIRPNEDSIFEIGSIYGSARSSVPSGYLLCDGSLVSRTIYSRLFNAIGITYGSGNGSTTFAIPDLRGAVPRGAGTSSGYVAGSDVTITLGSKQGDQMQGHIASYTSNQVANSATSGGIAADSFPTDRPNFIQGLGGGSRNINSFISSDGTNGSPRVGNETRMKNLGVNFFIKF